MSFQALFINLSIHQDPKINSTVQNIKKEHFSLASISPHPRSRRGADLTSQGEGRWSRSSKTALERSDVTEKFQFRESHTETETKKPLTESLSSQKHQSLKTIH